MKLAFRILSTFFLSIALVVFLQLYAEFREGASNGFKRRIVSKVLSGAKRYFAGSASLYIISLDSVGARLGSTTESGRVLSVPYSLSKVDSLVILLPDSIHFAWGAAKFIGFGHHIFLEEGVTPNIFKTDGTIQTQCAWKSTFPSFDLLTPFDSGFGCRIIDTLKQKYTIRILGAKESMVHADGILVPQKEGFFSCDGMLFFDNLSHRFIYVYYYRNELTSFTPSFDSVYHGKTIDTVSWAHISTHTIKSEGKLTFSSPPLKVNKHACTWNGLLFIYSGLRADNENGKLAFTSSVIDVYKISNFKYFGSFYLPNNDKEGIRDFAVYNDHLVALRGKAIYDFHINLATLNAGN